MRFEWDPEKARKNVKKHACSFEQAALIFSDQSQLTMFDDSHSESEERWITIGTDTSGTIRVVVHTYSEEHGDEVVRIISARNATRKEQAQYLSRKEKM